MSPHFLNLVSPEPLEWKVSDYNPLQVTAMHIQLTGRKMHAQPAMVKFRDKSICCAFFDDSGKISCLEQLFPEVKTMDLLLDSTKKKIPVISERVPVPHIKRHEENGSHLEILVKQKGLIGSLFTQGKIIEEKSSHRPNPQMAKKKEDKESEDHLQGQRRSKSQGITAAKKVAPVGKKRLSSERSSSPYRQQKTEKLKSKGTNAKEKVGVHPDKTQKKKKLKETSIYQTNIRDTRSGDHKLRSGKNISSKFLVNIFE